MKTLLALLLLLAPVVRADFADDFRAAVKSRDQARQVELVTSDQEAAVLYAVDVCEQIGERPNEKLEQEFSAISSAWREAVGTRFVDHVYEYCSLLSPATRRHRAGVLARYRGLVEDYEKAEADEDKRRFPGLGGEFEGLAGSFDEAGDRYHKAECWRYAGLCFDEGNLGEEDADQNRAWEAYQEAIEAREQIDLLDGHHAWMKDRSGKLDDAGYGAPPTEAELQATAEERAAAAKKITLAFELVDEIDSVGRPVYYADENFTTWHQVPMGTKGSSAPFPGMERDAPTIVRTGPSDAGFDLDGDGAEDVDIPLTGNLEPVELTIGSGANERKWAALFAIADERRVHQLIEINMAPSDFGMTLYYANAASMVGELDGERFQIFDDNMDGIYGSAPAHLHTIGLADGNDEWVVDSIRIGKAKQTIPWSEYVQVGKQWYQLERGDRMDELTAHPVEPETGKLGVDFKGLKPDYLIVRGAGKYENTYFDLASAGKKGMEVPAGRYSIITGRVSKGKRTQMMKALIVPGDAKTLTVRPGDSRAFELGAPFGFHWEHEASGEQVKVRGLSVVVEGRGGERYDRIWNAVPRPEVSVRKKGAKKGSKGEKMRILENQLDIGNVPGSWFALWHPLDLELENGEGSDAELQLFEKKNKLFGKIESEWRGRE